VSATRGQHKNQTVPTLKGLNDVFKTSKRFSNLPKRIMDVQVSDPEKSDEPQQADGSNIVEYN
jgi:hypothetical protein